MFDDDDITTGTGDGGADGGAEPGPEGPADGGADTGTVFTGDLRLTRAEQADLERAARLLAPPAGVRTTFNGELLRPREAAVRFEESLATELSDEQGVLRPTIRKTGVSLYETQPGESSHLYELGIPVVALPGGERWHVDVAQKLPLGFERDQVPASYLRALRTYTLNHAHGLLVREDANAKWLDDAISDRRVTAAALKRTLDLRFGRKRTTFDPSDPEANHRAVAAGYTVIPTRGLPKGVAGRARELGAVKPSGQVTPSPRPYSNDPDAPARKALPADQWTPGMVNIAEYAQALAQRLMNVSVSVELVSDPACRNFAATYGQRTLEFNALVLGRRWFDDGPTDAVNALLIHEFGHEYERNHLSDRFHKALCRLGAQLTALALAEPDFFDAFAPTASLATAGSQRESGQ